MSDGPLSGVVIAFDIDNTLLDPTGEGYRRTVEATLAEIDLGLPPDKAFAAFEKCRSWGNALERLGLANPMHDRSHPHGIAALCLTMCANDVLARELGIDREDREAAATSLAGLADLHGRSHRGPFDHRLDAEVELRGRLGCDEATVLRDTIVHLAAHPRIRGWSDLYEATARSQPVVDHRPLLARLEECGAIPIVISEGRSTIQLDKIERMGLTDVLKGRVLVTEAVADVPTRAENQLGIDYLIDEGEDKARVEGELMARWVRRCGVAELSRKSPAFYATCLHAIQDHINRPEAALSRSLHILPENWLPLRFVMVGDRYDSDVEPLIDLLGRDIGMTVRLQAGKYGHRHPLSEVPADRHPSRTFTDWNAIVRFLTEELRAEDVAPIKSPPEPTWGAVLSEGCTWTLKPGEVRCLLAMTMAAPRDVERR